MRNNASIYYIPRTVARDYAADSAVLMLDRGRKAIEKRSTPRPCVDNGQTIFYSFIFNFPIKIPVLIQI